MIKTDNAAEVGQHVFERAGLGLAPFKFVGMSENAVKCGVNGETKAGGSCDYCGTGIRFEFWLKSADAKTFKVGCDCINKSGDAGLMRAYKTSHEYRKHQRNLRAAKAQREALELAALVESLTPALSAKPHPYGYTDRQTGAPLTMLDYVKYSIGCCGASGRAGWLRRLKRPDHII